MATTSKAASESLANLIELLAVACKNDSMRATLQNLLSMANAQRQTLLHNWVNDLIMQKAPQDFTQAISSLIDDNVAEAAYVALFQCRR